MIEPTDKQLKLIKNIETLLNGIAFKGTTRKEATQFITQHLPQYLAKKEFLFEVLNNENHY